MIKSVFILSLLAVLSSTCQAVICEGNTANNCNGMANTCNSEGLCVIHSLFDRCCTISSTSTDGTCISDEDPTICEGDGMMGITSIIEDTDTQLNEQTSNPTPRPTPSPTDEPTVRPTDTPTVSSAPSETCYRLEIGLIFDEYPGETRWEITKGRRNTIDFPGSAVVVKSSPFYDPKNGYEEASETHIICLPEGKYTFTIMDRNKDGMCCGNGEGRYAVTYQATGEIIKHGSEFEQFETVTFTIPYEAPPLKDENNDGVEDRTQNVIPPMILTDNGIPISKCENEFGLQIITDDYGVETTWELRERAPAGESYEEGKVVASGGPYTSDFEYDISYCVLPGKYTFVFYDWQCDGLIGKDLTGSYKLKVNGEEVYTGGGDMDDYWEEVKLEFKKDQPDAAKTEASFGSKMIDGNGMYWITGVVSVVMSMFMAM